MIGGHSKQNIEVWTLTGEDTFDVQISNFQIDEWKLTPMIFNN